MISHLQNTGWWQNVPSGCHRLHPQRAPCCGQASQMHEQIQAEIDLDVLQPHAKTQQTSFLFLFLGLRLSSGPLGSSLQVQQDIIPKCFGK